MKVELAAITRTAPATSSRCGRSRRGNRRRIVNVITSANTQSGKFHRKITGQDICSEIHPPSAGPLAPAVVNAIEKYM